MCVCMHGCIVVCTAACFNVYVPECVCNARVHRVTVCVRVCMCVMCVDVCACMCALVFLPVWL